MCSKIVNPGHYDFVNILLIRSFLEWLIYSQKGRGNNMRPFTYVMQRLGVCWMINGVCSYEPGHLGAFHGLQKIEQMEPALGCCGAPSYHIL
jgi:hypothetical protein